MMTRGEVVVSLAGKDKGFLLVVLGEKHDKIVVSDGRKRKMQKPKYKNPKHLKPTGLSVEEHSLKSNKLLRNALSSCKETLK